MVMVATTVLVWGPGSTGSQQISALKVESAALILLRLRRSGNKLPEPPRLGFIPNFNAPQAH